MDVLQVSESWGMREYKMSWLAVCLGIPFFLWFFRRCITAPCSKRRRQRILVMFISSVSTLLAGFAVVLSSFSAPANAAPQLLAELEYGSFQGAYSAEYNISYWQKIPFAAPPVGENRFRAPQPPIPITGIYDSSQSYDFCPQRTVCPQSRPILLKRADNEKGQWN
jgi:hypothetical protein